jgi:hypothetical protein
MSKEFIFSDFKNLKTAAEKVEYLKQLSTLNIPFDIKYENLIKVWSQPD